MEGERGRGEREGEPERGISNITFIYHSEKKYKWVLEPSGKGENSNSKIVFGF
jgi:hypothetical protein